MDLEAAVLAAFPDFEIDERALANRNVVRQLPYKLKGTLASGRDWYLPMILIAASRSWAVGEGNQLCRELSDRLYLAAVALCPEENPYAFKPYGAEKIIQREFVILIKDCTREHLVVLVHWAQAFQVLWRDLDEHDKIGAIVRCLSARIDMLDHERKTL
jgi:hypothetical protein